MKKSKIAGLLPFILPALVLAACNSPAGPSGPDDGIEPAAEPYVVDISAGSSLWNDGNTTATNDDGSVTITYVTGKDWPAWGINFYTGDIAGRDLSGYGTLEIEWSAEYPEGTADTDADDQPNKQIKLMLLCGGLDADNNKTLEDYKGVETKTTTSIDLTPSSSFTAQDKKDVQQLALQAKVPGTVLTIYSITFQPLKTATSGDTISGAAGFWTPSDSSQYTHDVVSYQGKTDVLKVNIIDKSGWAPVRVDLKEYAEKEVKLEVSMNIWMDAASKIMWQVNDTGYTVISGGNDSYAANEWVEFTGTKTVTLPPFVEGSGNPWFYLDSAGLKNDAFYYIADFELKISVLE